MQRALFLAERGRGTTTPNPVVGALVVSDDGIVRGQGAHRVAGGPHAEVVALDAAGLAARGATLFCTLEPCCHVGRTGPCVERIAAAGIRRVVAALEDPNPRVAGGGYAWLRSRGIEVVESVERDAAARQNAPFVTWITARRPHVTIKCAMSADGYVGHADRRVMLTTAQTDRVMHRQRAAIDAVAVGSSSVLVDDPVLTARFAYRERPLTRVVFDRRGRVGAHCRLFETLAAGPILVFVDAQAATSTRANELRARGAEVLPMPDRDSLLFALRELASRDVLALLVEGGPTLHRAFWDAGLVDRVQIIETPHEMLTGLPAFVPAHDDARVTRRRIRTDVLVEWDVHRPH